MVRYKVAQAVLSIMPIFMEDPLDNLSKSRLLVVGIRNDSRRGPRLCREASKVSETNSSPPTDISSRCSQTATRRVLARPSHPGYPQMRHLADNSLGQAAKVLLHLGVPGTGLTRPGCCLSGDILQSCRPPDC